VAIVDVDNTETPPPLQASSKREAQRIEIMRLSTKSRYAVTAMLDLALNGSQGPVTLADISENQSISLSYLEQLFSALRAKGLVRGVRGPGGGYYLGREASRISIADVVCAVDDYVEYTRARAQAAPQDAQCTTRTLWEDLSDQVYNFIDGITLHDLVMRGEQRMASARAAQAKPAVIGLKQRAA
jgi:Rrf2 family iron-sulfur cluster assembly transcriptional regulator